VADVNGDKVPDVIKGFGNAVKVLLRNGNGNFGLLISSQLGFETVFGSDAIHLNGDGNNDSVISRNKNGQISPQGSALAWATATAHERAGCKGRIGSLVWTQRQHSQTGDCGREFRDREPRLNSRKEVFRSGAPSGSA
jgi:hypothetical protein